MNASTTEIKQFAVQFLAVMLANSHVSAKVSDEMVRG